MILAKTISMSLDVFRRQNINIYLFVNLCHYCTTCLIDLRAARCLRCCVITRSRRCRQQPSCLGVYRSRLMHCGAIYCRSPDVRRILGAALTSRSSSTVHYKGACDCNSAKATAIATSKEVEIVGHVTVARYEVFSHRC